MLPVPVQLVALDAPFWRRGKRKWESLNFQRWPNMAETTQVAQCQKNHSPHLDAHVIFLCVSNEVSDESPTWRSLPGRWVIESLRSSEGTTAPEMHFCESPAKLRPVSAGHHSPTRLRVYLRAWARVLVREARFIHCHVLTSLIESRHYAGLCEIS